MAHECHADGCFEPIPPKMLFCPPHWRQTPKWLKQRVWLEYREGQEKDKRPSARYMAVQQFAVAMLAFRDLETAIGYLDNSERWRQRAISSRAGDPYEDQMANFADNLRAAANAPPAPTQALLHPIRDPQGRVIADGWNRPLPPKAVQSQYVPDPNGGHIQIPQGGEIHQTVVGIITQLAGEYAQSPNDPKWLPPPAAPPAWTPPGPPPPPPPFSAANAPSPPPPPNLGPSPIPPPQYAQVNPPEYQPPPPPNASPAPAAPPPQNDAGRKCGNCGQIGHNARTCPNKAAPQQTQMPAAPPPNASPPQNGGPQLTVYLGCRVSGSTHGERFLDYPSLLAQVHAIISANDGVADYSFIEYGKGSGLLKSYLSQLLDAETGAVSIEVDVRMRETPIVLSMLLARADRVVSAI